MKEFFETAIAFFGELTWKRLRGFLILLGVVAVGLMVFDGYTSYFTLSRLHRSAELIAQVQAIEAAPVKRSPELDSAYKTLCTQVSEAVKAKPWTLRLSAPSIEIPRSRFWKFAAAAAPWVLFSLIMVRDVFRRKENALSGCIGVLVMAIFFGATGLFVPNIFWPWFNLLVYPVLLPFLVFTPFIYMSIKFAKNKQVEQTTNL